jgi:hypothetical protein
MMESGRYGSVTELAAAEKINQSYVCRVLRLTLLAPEIVEAALGQRRDLPELETLLKPLPIAWCDQKKRLLAAAT